MKQQLLARFSISRRRRMRRANEAALRELRSVLGDIGCALASEASVKLSDLRLLDMLTWAA